MVAENIPLGATLTEEQARQIFSRGEEAVVFVILELAKQPAERSIRPAVIIRKNSRGNRSQKGADCQAVLLSVFRTLKQRGHDPIRTVTAALAEYPTTETLPPLPTATSDG